MKSLNVSPHPAPEHGAQGHRLKELAGEGRIVFGLGRIHHLHTPAARLRLIESVLDAGISTFDTAPAYGNGLAERSIRLLPTTVRTQIKVNTKAGIPVWIYPEGCDSLFPLPRLLDQLTGHHRRAYQSRDFTPSSLRISLDDSLRRMGIDQVNVFYLHEPLCPPTHEAWQEIESTMGQLIAEGKIGAWGVAGPRARYSGGAPILEGIQYQRPASEWWASCISDDSAAQTTLYGIHSFSQTLPDGDGIRALLGASEKRNELLRLILATTKVARVHDWNTAGER